MKSDETHSTSLCERVELHEWHRPPPPQHPHAWLQVGGSPPDFAPPPPTPKSPSIPPWRGAAGRQKRNLAVAGARWGRWRDGAAQTGGHWGMLGGCCPPRPHPHSPSSSSLRRGQRDAHGTVRALLFLGGQRSPAALPRALRGGAWDRPPPRRPRPSKRLCLLLLKPPRSTHFCSWHLSNAAPLIKN